MFTQDENPRHTTKIIKAWLSRNVTECLVTLLQSPNIYPIENLWSYLDKKIREHDISNKENLINALQKE